MTCHSDSRRDRGYSLVELMITIAIISILATIAIPLYNGYIREGHFTAMRSNMNGLRTVIEDYRLDNGNYGATGNLVGVAAIDTRFNWDPAGDSGAYTFTVSVTAADSYDVWAVLNANNATWVRCETRFQTCCDSETSSSSSPSSAC